MEFDKVEKKLRQAESICKNLVLSFRLGAGARLPGGARRFGAKDKRKQRRASSDAPDRVHTLARQAIRQPSFEDAFDIAKEDVAKELEAKQQATPTKRRRADEAKKAEYDRKIHEPRRGKARRKALRRARPSRNPVPVLVKVPAAPRASSRA